METILRFLKRLITERPEENDELESYYNYFKLLMYYMIFGGALTMLIIAFFKLIKQ